MAVMANQLGKALLHALGLPKNTISFTLRAHAGDIVTIDCTYQPDIKSEDVAAALEQFHLVRKNESQIAASIARLDAHNLE